jgi:hypothetical protein
MPPSPTPKTTDERGGGGRSGSGGSHRIKEKNRLAQQRFRAKQKNMVACLKQRLAALEDVVSWLWINGAT